MPRPMVPAPMMAMVLISMRRVPPGAARPPQRTGLVLRLGAQCEDAVGGLVVADDNLGAADQQWAANQVGSFGHELDGLGASWRLFRHVAFAVEIVASIEKILVIAGADEIVEFGFG